jgi:hypothetical protein
MFLSRNTEMSLYEYQPLANPSSIRILALHPALDHCDPLQCELIHEDREEIRLDEPGTPCYEPVSYVLGEDPIFSHDLFCDQARRGIPITPNVDKMLRYLPKPTRISHLWVDAICLNQLDLTEKAIQVPLMGDIYFVPGLSVANAGVMRHHAALKNSLNILYIIRLLQSQLYIALSYYVQAL